MIIGIDGWSRHDEDADHLAHQVREVVGGWLGRVPVSRDVTASVVLATHEVRSEQPHTAVSCAVAGVPSRSGPPVHLLDALADLVGEDGAVVVTAPGLPDGSVRGTDPGAVGGAWLALAAAAMRSSGRLVHYPGEQRLADRLTVADVLAGSCVDEVVVVGGAPLEARTVVDTRGFVRPRLASGRVQLLVQPAAGGVMVPFEKENPERCCEDH